MMTHLLIIVCYTSQLCQNPLGIKYSFDLGILLPELYILNNGFQDPHPMNEAVSPLYNTTTIFPSTMHLVLPTSLTIPVSIELYYLQYSLADGPSSYCPIDMLNLGDPPHEYDW